VSSHPRTGSGASAASTRRRSGRVSFIRKAQEVGFSLEDIATILDDETGAWRGLVDDKLIELAERRDRLDTMISVLSEIRECGCGAVASCPRVTPS
jgi:DNA-binding transcriptional MerR regulator